MTQVAEWLDHHHVDVVTIVGTAAILIVAAIIILVLSRLLQRWLSYLQFDRLESHRDHGQHDAAPRS